MVEPCSNEAIIIFDNDEIIKEITYAEFQAILDNYVPLHDVALKSMKAVYVYIDAMLPVITAVFFHIEFDRKGFVDNSWNVPLRQLAGSAVKSPDMGFGQMSVVSYSHCPIDCHKHSLWDPATKGAVNHLDKIGKTLKSNKLGLFFNKKDKVLADDIPNGLNDGSKRSVTAANIKEQIVKYELLSAKAEQDKRQLSLDYQERILVYQQQVNDYQQQLDDCKQRLDEQVALNLTLEERMSGQADKIQGMREYFESKLQVLQSASESEIQALRDHYESELLLQVESTVADYKAQLKSLEVKLLYRSEHVEKLQQELVSLQRENKRLLDTSDVEILHRLNEAGVTFAVYHPGAGHLTLQLADIKEYLENPMAYVAAQCGVNEHLYCAWLEHFYMPTCQHESDNGEVCDTPVDRIEDPKQFIIGESNRCPNHRTQTPSIISCNKQGH